MKALGFSLSHWLGKQFVPGLHEHLISRTRFIDDLVEKYTNEGMEQYVVLGAGYDSAPIGLTTEKPKGL